MSTLAALAGDEKLSPVHQQARLEEAPSIARDRSGRSEDYLMRNDADVDAGNVGALSAVDKVFAILEHLSHSSGRGLGVTEIARACSVPKATAHRILKSLVVLDVLHFDQDTKRYSLGPSLLSIGLAAQRQLDIPQLARPLLRELVDRSQETATLSIRQGDSRVYLDQVPSPQEIKMTVTLGMSFPLYAGASSKAILSTLSEDELSEYLGRVTLNPLTDSTILDAEALRSELHEIAAAGFAVSRGERQRDAASVAAPVLDSGGEAFGSLSISGPIQRWDDNSTAKHGTIVKEVAERLSARLGFRS